MTTWLERQLAQKLRSSNRVLRLLREEIITHESPVVTDRIVGNNMILAEYDKAYAVGK